MKHLPVIELCVELNNGDLARVGSNDNQVAIGACNTTTTNMSNILMNQADISDATYQPNEMLGGSG